MGISLRIFIVEDDDTVHRLPMAKYDRLLNKDPKECLPQYAAKRIRYALVVVDLINRKPVEILKFQYSFLKFDADGKLDQDESEREARLAFDVVGPVDTLSGNVIDASHRFAEKRFRDKYTWEASPEIKSVIVNEIFGDG
jgi:hypothetical protein